MAKGGKREGSGRPKGATTRPQIRDYISEKEIKELITKAKEQAKAGDTRLLTFVLEQIFGRAVQPLGNDNGKALIIKFDDSFISPPKENK